MKKILITLFVSVCFLPSLFASQPSEKQEDVPAWLERTSFGLEGGSDKKLKYFFETVQPLLGTEEEAVTLFNHTRLSLREERPIFSTGFGLRKIFKEAYLLGVNTFYDYQDLRSHSRGGLGFEAFCDSGLEARLNTYFRISHEHEFNDLTTGQEIEKVANGFDWELGGPLPYLPFIRMYGGGYLYDFEHFRNKSGWKARAEYNPVKNSRITVEFFDDNKRDDVGFRAEGAVTLAFTSFNWKDILKDLGVSKEAFPKVNLKEKKLERVIRDFDITVIRSTKSSGLVVEGGRT